VVSILDANSPVDPEERASQYGLTSAAADDTAADYSSSATTGGKVGSGAASVAANQTRSEQVIPLSEETLNVGKRAVSGGTTRLRRYVVEHPVEAQVRLRDEHVAVERHRERLGLRSGRRVHREDDRVHRDDRGSSGRKDSTCDGRACGAQGRRRAGRDGARYGPPRGGRNRSSRKPTGHIRQDTCPQPVDRWADNNGCGPQKPSSSGVFAIRGRSVADSAPEPCMSC